jgi:hypothetical protein
MCTSDIFLAVLAIFFPPIAGKSQHIHPPPSPPDRTLRTTPHLAMPVLIKGYLNSMGQGGSLHCRLGHQPSPLSLGLHPRPHPCMVHHRQIPGTRP